MALITAAIAWTFVASLANDGSRPWPTVAAFIAVTLGLVVGRTIAARATAVSAPAAVGALAGILAGALPAFPGLCGRRGPLGYGNANGAFFALLTWAAVILRVAIPGMTRPTRLATTAVGAASLAACVVHARSVPSSR